MENHMNETTNQTPDDFVIGIKPGDLNRECSIAMLHRVSHFLEPIPVSSILDG
jgi:hypothetical protein